MSACILCCPRYVLHTSNREVTWAHNKLYHRNERVVIYYIADKQRFFKLVFLCLISMVQRCNIDLWFNTAYWRQGIAINRTFLAKYDAPPEARDEKKLGLTLFDGKVRDGEPSDVSGVRSKQFKDEDFVNCYIRDSKMPGADKLSVVVPRLKQDTVSTRVCPSKYYDETSTTLSARDQRCIV